MKISKMLPFLDKEEIDSLVDDVLENKVDLKLYHILPFVSEEKIDAVIHRALNDDTILVKMKHLLPFVNDRQMNVLYEAYDEGIIKRDCDVNEDEMLPYLSKEKIKAIFEKKLKEMKLEIKKNIKDAFDEITNDNKE